VALHKGIPDAMTSTLTDARRAMRDALHRLVHGADDWAQPSLSVFRNRLLDEVGSDARPLANILLEAIERGVLYALPRAPLDARVWSAKSAPLVNQWVADRFLQPEVARWAIEAWGFAFGCIDASQLTAFVDRPDIGRSSHDDTAPRSGHGSSNGGAYALPPLTPARAVSRSGALPPSTGGAWRGGARSGALPTATHRPVHRRPQAGAYSPPSGYRSASGNWVIKNANRFALLSGAIGLAAYIYIFVDVANRAPATNGASQNARVAGLGRNAVIVSADGELSGPGDPAQDPPRQSTAEIPTAYTVVERGQPVVTPRFNTATTGIGVGGEATRVPLAPGSGNAPSMAMTRLPAEGATGSAYLELAARSNARGLSDGAPDAPTPTATPNSPGVPGITRNAMPLRDADIDRVRRVAPATRPAPRLVQAPSTAPAPGRNTPATAPRAALPGLDQVRLASGRRLQGRVEVIRTSSVVFRDAESGLRYEFAKDEIDEIITEFGNPVRFKQRGGGAVGSTSDRRTTSVAGRYDVKYDAAQVNGSASCRDLWRGPSGTDAAIVRHRAGDDTLSIAFAGGDVFASVLDADGFFSSTFRVMPGQAELATALTTRLSGRFADGKLALQVNVIGYRRAQGTTGVACHIIVDATGTRAANLR